MGEAKTIKVRYVYEFEFFADGYDPEFVDIEGLAKDCAFRDLKDGIRQGDIIPDDFKIITD